MIGEYNKLIFELSKKGRRAYSLPQCDVPEEDISKLVPEKFIEKEELKLPEVSQEDKIRYPHQNFYLKAV